MIQYDFNMVTERRNTNSLKYDFAVERGYPPDVLPLWVADMDFPAPKPVLDALHKAVEHGIFGYSEVKDEYYGAVSEWFLRHFEWKPKKDWLVKTPGVVFALAAAIRAFTQPGDGIIIQTPVYYPFFSVIQDNGRVLIENELLYNDGTYKIDFWDFESKIRDNNVKMFILCSPHNPVGRVWTEGELHQIGEICRKYGVIVASDEIHCDFAFPNHPHQVFVKACPELLHQSIICTAPSKTFNLAGLQVSNIWIPNEEYRRKFRKEMDRSGYSQLNALGLTAALAAYKHGEEWFLQCKNYLHGNLDYLQEYIENNIPEIRLVKPDGTYFAWLDCSGLGLDRRELNRFIIEKAKLWLDAGYIFKGRSDQFQRIVLACPRRILKQALSQLEAAVRNRA